MDVLRSCPPVFLDVGGPINQPVFLDVVGPIKKQFMMDVSGSHVSTSFSGRGWSHNKNSLVAENSQIVRSGQSCD